MRLQCSPWGAGSGAVRRNSASSPASLAGRGWGEGLGVLGARFDGLDGGEAALASGTPTTDGGDRRGCPERRASGREGQWAVGVASRGASGGGEGLLGSGFGSPPELAAAGPQGAGAARVRRGSAWRGVLAQGGARRP
jgi:hypothetical protein